MAVVAFIMGSILASLIASFAWIWLGMSGLESLGLYVLGSVMFGTALLFGPWHRARPDDS